MLLLRQQYEFPFGVNTMQFTFHFFSSENHWKLALQVTSCLFRLALRGYYVASLPRRFALCACNLGHFAPSGFALQFPIVHHRCMIQCSSTLLVLWCVQYIWYYVYFYASGDARSVTKHSSNSLSLRSMYVKSTQNVKCQASGFPSLESS